MTAAPARDDAAADVHGEGDPSRGALARRSRSAGLLLDRRPLLGLTATTAVALVLFLVHLQRSPDLTLDELSYALTGQQISSAGSISWAGTPVLVHPPLFFLAVAGWLRLTGSADSALLTAVMDARYLAAGASTLTALLTCLLTRALLVGAPPARRGWATLCAGLLVASDGFLLRFGRMVLIEPVALAASLVAVLLAWRLRRAPWWGYAAAVGALMGLALLTKVPAAAIVAGPFLGQVLLRSRRGVLREVGALAVAGAVWSAFPLWAASSGQWTAFVEQSTVSARRLLGLLQLTGLNRDRGLALESFVGTFPLYLSGYLAAAGGGVVLVVLVVRFLARTEVRHRQAVALLAGTGIGSYGFLGYSVLFGQANEQLSVYVVPAAAVLLAGAATGCFDQRLGRGPRWEGAALVLRRCLSVGAAVAVLAGLVSWGAYTLVDRDDATIVMAQHIEERYPTCTRVNATGDRFKWALMMPDIAVPDFSSGPQALANRTSLFLLSPKDVEFGYGNTTPELASWIRANGTLLEELSSRTYGSVALYRVGPVPGVADADPASCGVQVLPSPSQEASAGLFAVWLVIVASVPAALAAVPAVLLAAGRRRQSHAGRA